MITSEIKPRLAVLVSGGGTTLQNLINSIKSGDLNASIYLIISSRKNIAAVEIAKKYQLPIEIIESRPIGEFSDIIFKTIRKFDIDLVVFAGWLHLLSIPNDFRMKVINIHPSLLPAFGGVGMYGKHVHQAVFSSGVKYSGCTVHFVDNNYDTGPIISQRVVNISSCVSPEEIAVAVFKQECQLYPESIKQIASGNWRLEEKRFLMENL